MRRGTRKKAGRLDRRRPAEVGSGDRGVQRVGRVRCWGFGGSGVRGFATDAATELWTREPPNPRTPRTPRTEPPHPSEPPDPPNPNSLEQESNAQTALQPGVEEVVHPV